MSDRTDADPVGSISDGLQDLSAHLRPCCPDAGDVGCHGQEDGACPCLECVAALAEREALECGCEHHRCEQCGSELPYCSATLLCDHCLDEERLDARTERVAGIIVPLFPCPAPDCESAAREQRLSGYHWDGCPRFTCPACMGTWSQHLVEGACPQLKRLTATDEAPTAENRGSAPPRPPSG